jgi:undecaprenyl-diphosphatase
MIEFFEEIDQQIVIAVNGWHTPFLDEVMWWISARITWVPLYLFLLYLAFRSFDRITFFKYIVLIIASVVITDLISVHLFKNVFMRYRPSHHLIISEQLHYYQIKPNEWYKGGTYGFVSSHAANFFAIITATLLAHEGKFPYLKWILLTIGIIICLSRIYLGVHYLSDVIAGGLLGTLISFLLFKFWYRSTVKLND